MGVSMIEGEIAEVGKSRSPPFGKATVYRKVVWRTASGEDKQLARLVVDRSMNAYMQPGSSGRFYVSQAIDQRGLFGFRSAGGAANYAWPSGARSAGIALTTVGALLLLTRLLIENAIVLLGVIALAYGIALLVLDNGNRKAGRALYDPGAEP